MNTDLRIQDVQWGGLHPSRMSAINSVFSPRIPMSTDAEFWSFAAAFNRFLKHKLCLAEEEGDPCNSPIIQAHTIPRSQMRRIAIDSHVYSFDTSLAQLERSDGKIAIKRFGIGQFSVLNCFCGRHDKAIFADVEDVPLTFSPRQLAVLHYRTVASELYRKIRMVEAISHQIEVHSKANKDRGVLAGLEALNEGNKLGMRDGQIAFHECQRILEQHDYGALSAMVVRFRRMPTIMTVGGFYPEFCFDGTRLQTLGNKEQIFETVSFNILTADDRAALAMIWQKGHVNPLAFARSFERQPPNHYTTLAIQASFEHLENTCAEPMWWDNLKKVEQDLLLRRMQITGEIFEERTGSSLQYSGVTHDDWDFDRLEFVNV